MRVIFVNRFYWPDEPATGQLLTDLAEALAQRGHDVTVITSDPGPGRRGAEQRNGVRILRVRSTRTDGAHLSGKALDWGTFLCAATWRLWRESRRDAVVIVMTDPPLLAIGAWMAARLRGNRLVHWVQDIYPELAIEVAGQRWLRAIRPLRNMAWRSADRCVTLGSDMVATLTRERVAPARVSVISNWAPAGVTPVRSEISDALRADWGLTGKFVVGYSGNLGRVHDVEAIALLAEALRNDHRIHFLVIGSGAQGTALIDNVARRGLTNVTFQPLQPRERLAASLAAADVHLVTLRPGCEHYVYPSKLYGIAAVGRPILFIGPAACDVARCVQASGLGMAITRDTMAEGAAFVRQLAAHPDVRAAHSDTALRFAAEHDRSTLARRWGELLQALATTRPAIAATPTTIA